MILGRQVLVLTFSVVYVIVVCVGPAAATYAQREHAHRTHRTRLRNQLADNIDPGSSFQDSLQSSHHDNKDSKYIIDLPAQIRSKRMHKRTSHRPSRHVYAAPVLEKFLQHAGRRLSNSNNLFHLYTQPFLRSVHGHHHKQMNLIDRIRAHVGNEIRKANGHLKKHHHSRGRPHSGPIQDLTHRPDHHHKSHHRKPTHHHHSSSSNLHDLRSEMRDLQHHHKKKQPPYQIFKAILDRKNDIPEDVEVFKGPLAPSIPLRPPTPTFAPSIPTHRSHWDTDDCNTSVLVKPLHQIEHEFTSISSSHNDFSPGHSLVSHTITRGDKDSPFLKNPIFHSSRKHHGVRKESPVSGIFDSGFMPLDSFHHSLQRVYDDLPSFSQHPFSSTHPRYPTSSSFGFQDESRKISVEDHLKGHGVWHSRGKDDAIPCIKCPPDTRVVAPRGSDCVIAHPPSPLSCTPRTIPEVHTVVTKGPSPGTILPEGHYSMVITILTSDATSSNPVTTCNVNYDVEVRKCPILPEVEGADVQCTAGRAWGSRCSWACREERILHGSSGSTCTGHTHPRWSRPPPVCLDRPFERPRTSSPKPHLPPALGGNCPPPPDVPGGHLICEVPSVEVLSRRDFIPKDEPVHPRLSKHGHFSRRLHLRSAPLELSSHPIASICRVECFEERTLRESDKGNVILTCAPNLSWDRSPPECYQKVLPTLRSGDCKDVSIPNHLVAMHLDGMQIPVFYTSFGKQAEVTCSTNEVEPGLLYIRKCKAVDNELKTKATCQHTISIQSTGIPKGSDSGLTGRPKDPRYATVADVFRDRKGSKKNSSREVIHRNPLNVNWKNHKVIPEKLSLPKEATLVHQREESSKGKKGKRMGKGEAAIMEAFMELEILVDDCDWRGQIAEAIEEELLSQEGCKRLTCNLPQTTCQYNAGQAEGKLSLSWVVRGTYEPLEDYYYDELQVPRVEADIEALVGSVKLLISSEDITRKMEAFSAAIDLTSFHLVRVDLVCSQPGHNFDPESNRCVL